jgi:DNA polymerase (family X)
MVASARERGHAYVAITDHGPAPAIAGGLSPEGLRSQAEEIAAVARRHPDVRVLRGVEVDIHEDGTLDLDDATLGSLDVVLAAVHSRFDLPRARQTRRILRALANPRVGVLAHPTCRLLGRRNPIDVDLEAVLREAARRGVAVEIDAQPERLDLDPAAARRARDLGATLVVSTDAHRDRELDFLRYGVDQARRAGLGPDAVLNTRPAEDVIAFLRSRRAPASS